MFESVDFKHIYRERNTLADVLAKDGSNVLVSSWQITEYRVADCFESVLNFSTFGEDLNSVCFLFEQI